MKKAFSIALALALVAIVLTGCAATDVILKYSPASLDKRTEDAAGSFVGLLAMRAGVPNTDELSGSDTDKASHGDDDFELENDFETMLKSI